MRRAHGWLTLCAAATLTLSACSSKAEDNAGSGQDGDLKTDVGVTDKEIKLGVLTDTSGVFKSIGLNLTQGNQLWADRINEEGGICDRDVSLVIKDHGYKPDNAVALYDQTKGEVAGFMQILGSPIIAAVKGKLSTDKVMSVIATQSTINLDVDELIMIGTGYDSEMINALSWAMKEGKLSEGGKIAHIYVDSEYGQNGLMGSQYFAKQHDIEVVPVPVSASDTDMTTTMTKVKDAGVDVIALTTTPAGTASIALQNTAQGLNLPLIGSNPTFAPTILSDPNVVSALENLNVFLGGEPYAGKSELSKEIQKTFDEKYPGEEPGYGVPAGYLEALAWQAILEKACDNGDMTREGLLEARLSLTEVDAQGLSDDMDLSDPGSPPVRSTYALKIDPNAPGGESIIEGPFTSDEVKDYKFPHQQK